MVTMGKSVPTHASSDSGIIGDPSIFVSPTRNRKKREYNSSESSTPTTASAKKRFDSSSLGKEIREGFENAEQLNCATKILIHTQMHGVTREARKQADDMVLHFASQTFEKFGIRLPQSSNHNRPN
jgi:hypothetical protein